MQNITLSNTTIGGNASSVNQPPKTPTSTNTITANVSVNGNANILTNTTGSSKDSNSTSNQTTSASKDNITPKNDTGPIIIVQNTTKTNTAVV